MTVHVTGAHASMMPKCIAIATCPEEMAGDAGDAAEAEAAPELAVLAGTEGAGAGAGAAMPTRRLLGKKKGKPATQPEAEPAREPAPMIAAATMDSMARGLIHQSVYQYCTICLRYIQASSQNV